MKIVNNNLPKEGVVIGYVHFAPGKPEEVEEVFGRDLIERKGFKEVTTKKDKEV